MCTAIQLSAPTTLALLSELVNDSWVEKKGLGNSNGGRKPDLFGMAAGKFYILCINIELFTVHISLFDNTLAPQGKTVAIPYSLSKDRESFQSVLKQAKELVKNSNIPQEKLAGVSMCLPGLTNPETGENFGYLTDNNDTRPLRDYCAAFFKVPVIIQNDVNAAALSELHCGKAKGKRTPWYY